MTMRTVYTRTPRTKKKRVGRRTDALRKCEGAPEQLGSAKMPEWIRYSRKVIMAVILVVAALAGSDIGATASPPPDPEKAISQTGDVAPSRNVFPRPLPEGVTEQMVEQGRGIFHSRGRCFQCHGKNGTGTFFAPALKGERHIHLQTASYQEIMDLIRSGVPRPKRYLTAMPPLGGASLTNNEVRAVAAYVFTLAE
jgi:mono/diheme cytochrome c family protein